MTHGRRHWLGRSWFGLVSAFLYAPIVVLAIFSFNDSRLSAVWRGFTWRWYAAALTNQAVIDSLRVSVIVAAVTTIVATVLGTGAALALARGRVRFRAAYEGLFFLPIIVPEIVVGFATVTYFGLIGLSLGMTTVIIAHVAFSLSYVFFVVRARLEVLDPQLEEAAMDLGATESQAFLRVTLPLLAPAIVASALLVFTLSLDDYVITSFVAGPGASTLPLRLYSMIKTGITPEMNAISTLLLVITVVLVALSFHLQRGRLTRTTVALAVGVVLAITLFTFGRGLSDVGRRHLNLLIWSSYISPRVVREFEQRYHARVRIETYDSNEAMLAKLRAGVVAYDVIVPSDYMVRILVKENLLRPLDHSRLPHMIHLDPSALALPFDPENRYSLPYVVGTTGIGYRRDKVAHPIDSWSVFWEERYRHRLVMLDDMREVFGVALRRLGFSINTTNESELRQARDLLIRQKPLVRAYDSAAFDQVLLSGDAWIVMAYNGQIAKAMMEDPNIAYALPREGCTQTVDNLSIPRTAQDPDLALAFINFLLEPRIAAENMNDIGYAIPNRAARPWIRRELRENPALFPPPEAVKNCDYLSDLGPMTIVYDRYWTELKIHP
jgi:spermidine/putrescine transport system permease protein